MANKKGVFWAGMALTVLPSLMLLMSGVMKLMQPPEAVEGFAKFGYSASTLLPLGLVELACLGLYLFPRTAVLGAILLTGYLGGATATHVRVGDAFFMPVLLGVFLWGGLYFRDERLRQLIPLRSGGTA